MKNKDNINPDHYKVGGIETWDYLKAKMSPTQLAGFALGNVIKYISRADHKNKIEDLKKAKWYLDKIIKEIEKPYVKGMEVHFSPSQPLGKIDVGVEEISAKRTYAYYDYCKNSDVNNYSQWLEAGKMIHNDFKGSDEGFNLWDSWSKTSTKYNEKETIKKWASFPKKWQIILEATYLNPDRCQAFLTDEAIQLDARLSRDWWVKAPGEKPPLAGNTRVKMRYVKAQHDINKNIIEYEYLVDIVDRINWGNLIYTHFKLAKDNE